MGELQSAERESRSSISERAPGADLLVSEPPREWAGGGSSGEQWGLNPTAEVESIESDD